VAILVALDSAKNQIAYVEGLTLYVLAMVPTQRLLVFG